MMNKVTARKREMLPPIATNQNQWKLLLHLFYSLSAELGCNPKLYHTDGPSTLWVLSPLYLSVRQSCERLQRSPGCRHLTDSQTFFLRK